MSQTLTNNARFDGLLGTESVFAPSTVSVEVFDVGFTKTASPMAWAGGDLTYTLTLSNDEDPTAEPPGLPLENAVITDWIETTIASFIPESVTVNGTTIPAANYTYTPPVDPATRGQLEIRVGDYLTDPIPAGGQAVVTFRVSRAD